MSSTGLRVLSDLLLAEYAAFMKYSSGVQRRLSHNITKANLVKCQQSP